MKKEENVSRTVSLKSLYLFTYEFDCPVHKMRQFTLLQLSALLLIKQTGGRGAVPAQCYPLLKYLFFSLSTDERKRVFPFNGRN